MAIFSFSRWGPSTILHLLCVFLDHPRSVFGVLYHCAKFGWNKNVVLMIPGMQVSMLCALGLKMLIHVLLGGSNGVKIGVSGNFLQFYCSNMSPKNKKMK